MMTGESIIFIAKEWGGANFTSCDHVFHYLARNNKVLWVNSVATRTPSLGSAHDWKKIFAKIGQYTQGLRQVGPTSWVYQPAVIPLPNSETAQQVNQKILGWSIRHQARRLGMKKPQLWSFIPNPGYGVGWLDESLVIYYCTDAWSQIAPGAREKIVAMEHKLLSRADLCFATSQLLLETHRQQNPNTFLAPHGVDHAYFSQALDAKTVPPLDIAGLQHPIVGFFGVIYHLIDIRLLEKIAKAHPEWSLVLIGVVRGNIEELKKLGNVHVLGHRPYQTIASYCKAFDVGLMPYDSAHEWIRHSNPIKMREYLSAGLPVVSTDVPEVRRYAHLVSIAQNHEDFIRLIERSLAEDTPELHRQRSEAMQKETWESRLAEVCQRVMEAKASKDLK